MHFKRQSIQTNEIRDSTQNQVNLCVYGALVHAFTNLWTWNMLMEFSLAVYVVLLVVVCTFL